MGKSAGKDKAEVIEKAYGYKTVKPGETIQSPGIQESVDHIKKSTT
jgi:hypothetical protein